jgi:hypothetical protein
VTVTLDLPWYYLKPHWLVIWFGALLYLGRVIRRRRLEFWEAFALISIVTYLLPLIAIADISNYGVRMIVPVVPVVFVLCATLPVCKGPRAKSKGQRAKCKERSNSLFVALCS